MAAVLLVDVLDHLFAPLVFEVDVDVGRLLSFLGDETFEQQIDLLRIDFGDLEAVADHGIRRRAAPLAQDAFRTGEADDVVNGQKIRSVMKIRCDL